MTGVVSALLAVARALTVGGVTWTCGEEMYARCVDETWYEGDPHHYDGDIILWEYSRD
jgi:hypothetical protein